MYKPGSGRDRPFQPTPPCYMGLSSCYWLYYFQHGVSHDVLTSQLEGFPSRRRLIESQKEKEKKGTGQLTTEDRLIFRAPFPIALLALGSLSCLAAWRLKPILPSEAPPVSKTKT